MSSVRFLVRIAYPNESGRIWTYLRELPERTETHLNVATRTRTVERTQLYSLGTVACALTVRSTFWSRASSVSIVRCCFCISLSSSDGRTW